MVKTVKGKVSRSSKGRTVAFIRPRANEANTNTAAESTRTPGTSRRATASPSELSSHCTTKPINKPGSDDNGRQAQLVGNLTTDIDVIEARNLSKTYRVHRRPAGLVAALRSVLHRRYENVAALSDVSFHIAPGERVGFLGPNGAGKTTALKTLSGLLYPTSGSVSVQGFVPQQRRPDFLRLITLVMGQKQQLLWDLPPAETFAMNRALFDLPRREAEATQKELVELLEVGPIIGKPTRQLSLGERMKCELVAALLHRPRVLFLDEPTIGLDVAMQARVRSFVRHYNESTGAAVLLTSHYMADVAALCPRVIVIDKGHLIYDGDLKELARRIRPEKRITMHFMSLPAPGQLERLQRSLNGDAPAVVHHSELKAVLAVPAAHVTEAVRAALEQLSVADISVEDPPLEEIMQELLTGGVRTTVSGE